MSIYHIPFRDLLIAASLKPCERQNWHAPRGPLPRSIDRGLIEADYGVARVVRGTRTLPRSIDRGLIEARPYRR